jgi:hypothetical protein
MHSYCCFEIAFNFISAAFLVMNVKREWLKYIILGIYSVDPANILFDERNIIIKYII